MTHTIPTSLICKRPDGWEAWCYLSNGQQLSRRFATEPTESELTAWGEQLVAQAEAEQPTPELDVKSQAATLFEQIKPLAYQDPVAVNEALNTAFTPDEINGVLSARIE